MVEPTIINDEQTPLEEQAPLEESPQEAQAPLEERTFQYIRVNPGDTVESIAAAYNTTPEEIIFHNNVNPDFLFTGHWLFV